MCIAMPAEVLDPDGNIGIVDFVISSRRSGSIS